MPAAGALAMPSPSADLATVWPFMEEWIEHVMTRQHIQDSYPKYMHLYTAVYNYCTSSRIHSSFENSALGSRTGANLSGSDLYDSLAQYFASHVEVLRQKAEPTYLPSMQGNGSALQPARDISIRQQDEGSNVHQVYILALVQWRDRLLYTIQSKDHRLVAALLKLIEKERNGEAIDTGLAKKVIDSFVTLGLNDNDQNKAQLQVYQKEFQTPFIEATEKYYARESAIFFQKYSSSVPEYLKKVEKHLREEEARVVRYLHFSTRRTLISKCEEALIRGQLGRMQEDAQRLLYADQDEDLQRMSQLLSRVPGGLDPLRKRFERDVNKAGLEAIADLQRAAAHSPGGTLEPKVVVDTLSEVYCKNQDIVSRRFRGEALSAFVATLDRAFRDLVNQNTAIGASPTSFPELLAKYTDALLRKNNKLCEEDALEDQLNKVMSLFKYIEDKDVFQTFYTIKLSRRLLYGLSRSDEHEAYMISKLKEGCGFEYTDKLQRMFTDIQLSKDLTNQFRERVEISHSAADLEVTFSVMILGTNVWPLSTPTHHLIVPRDILPTYEQFQRFYQNKHSGRKLIWFWSYSENELRTNYLNQIYVLMTSSYQMAVLIQYNENDVLSLDELVTATGTPGELLTQVLAVLVKARILISKETEQYGLNLNFKSKKIRVKLNQPIKAEVKHEPPDVLKNVYEDRKYVIQATVVRIMKARQTMKNQALVQEVMSQISTRFAPRTADVKKAIDKLIEKEYIERVNDEMDLFKYVA